MPRLSRLEQNALADLTKALRGQFCERLVRLVLFGSRARGEGRSDSDLDVLVQIRGHTRAERRAVQDLCFDVGLEHGLLISPLVADPSTWRHDLPLARTIEREGVVL